MKVMTPHKKPRKSSLAKEKLEENKIISGLRIVVEHAIGGMKRFDCLLQVYRNRKGQDDRMTSIAAATKGLPSIVRSASKSICTKPDLITLLAFVN
jgi:hypothetical protein